MSFDEQPDGDIHGECAAEIRQLEIALRIKTEEHDCCAKDLLLWRTSYESACTQNVHLCAKIDDCRPFLKEGESPAEGLARFRTKITEIFGRWTLFIDEQKLKDAACRPYLKEGETVADALKRLSERKTVRSLCEAYEACKPFLKDGEAPAECLARNRNDIALLMGKWGAEKMTSARLRTALDKIAQTTGSDDPCRPLVQIARDALKRLTKELDAVRSELANAEDERKGQ